MDVAFQRAFSYRIFTDRIYDQPAATTDYSSLYTFWHQQWLETFNQLKGTTSLYSDEFDRLDEVSGIFLQNAPISVICYHWYDLSMPSHVQHSYFKTYPEEAMRKLQSLGAKYIMTMNNLAIAKDWRKVEQNLICDSSIALACKRFLASDAEYLVAFTRNDRRMNDVCYRHGARPLLQGLREHNVEIDIIAISREDAVIATNENTASFTSHLWETRRIFGDRQHGQRRSTAKAA